MDKIEITEAACPSCSPEEAVTHTNVKNNLIKCEECGFIHRLPVKKEKNIKLKVIVSRQSVSEQQTIEVGANDDIHVDDEFVVDTGKEVSGVHVQSIELKTSARTEHAKAKDIRAIWARAIDEVIVKIAMQSGAKTESVDYKVNGDYEFAIGDEMKIKGNEVKISSIKTREGAHVKREGSLVKAKNVKRIYSKIVGQSMFKPRKTAGVYRSGTMKPHRGRSSGND